MVGKDQPTARYRNCIALLILLVLVLYLFIYVYVPMWAEYNRTKEFEKAVCEVTNVTVHCDSRQRCSCTESSLEFCATIRLKFSRNLKASKSSLSFIFIHCLLVSSLCHFCTYIL